ncbi:MAG: hypothetical protein ACE5G2_09210 [Candidatus Krumholzibacteriia bacterium]
MRRRVLITVACALALVALQSGPLQAGEVPGTGEQGEVGDGPSGWLSRLGFHEPLTRSGAEIYANHGRHRRGSAGRTLERRGWRRRHPRRDSTPESYLILKGGGLHVSEDPSTDGVYLGLELGGSVEDVVDIGFSVDYFHRSSSEMLVLQESEVEDLPFRLVATLDESAVHLVPIGLTMRVRIPLAGDRVTPFVSGTIAYEALFLENPSTEDPDLQGILEEDETFTGFGWQAAAGVDVGLSPSFGLFGEVGLHRSSPSREIELDGVPVDLKVDLDGAFLRGGLRVTL